MLAVETLRLFPLLFCQAFNAALVLQTFNVALVLSSFQCHLDADALDADADALDADADTYYEIQSCLILSFTPVLSLRGGVSGQDSPRSQRVRPFPTLYS